MNNIKKIIQAANSEPKKVYNILTFPTHERYETQLCKTGHNFFSFHIPNAKKWNEAQVSIPSNYHILPESNACHHLDYDFILVQSRYWQFNMAQQLNQFLRLPIVCLDHTLPPDTSMIKPSDLVALKNMHGDFNVFISEYSKSAWGIETNSKVIHHSIDSEVFKPLNIPREKRVLTVANDFIKRNYCLHYDLWCEITEGMMVDIVGDTQGLSTAASSTEELVKRYNSSQVYFNTSTTPIPMSLLEAMSCGCAVVTVSASMMPEIIVNGENGFISNDKAELKSYILRLQEDDELRNKLGTNARKTILEKFSENRFISEWNTLFNDTYEVTIS